jgi:hypothetical protein
MKKQEGSQIQAVEGGDFFSASTGVRSEIVVNFIETELDNFTILYRRLYKPSRPTFSDKARCGTVEQYQWFKDEMKKVKSLLELIRVADVMGIRASEITEENGFARVKLSGDIIFIIGRHFEGCRSPLTPLGHSVQRRLVRIEVRGQQ